MKKILSMLAIILSITIYGENISVGDFEKGDNGFSGISIDNTAGRESSSSAKLVNKDQKWITASKEFSLDRELKSISFWIKSPDVDRIAVRIVDSTGQCFQPRASFKADGSWQEIKVKEFTGAEIFGGAGDKKIHNPIKKLEFILEVKGTVWVDDIEADLSNDLLPEAAERKKLLGSAKALTIGNFEMDNDGFSEGISFVSGEGRNGGGAAKLENKNQKWVESAKDLASLIKNDFLELSFWVKSSDAGSIAVRFKDSTDQSFQQRFKFEADGKWHQVVVGKFDKGESWGGAKDRAWHPPAKEIRFILEKKGSVLIDDVEAKLDPRKIVQGLKIFPGAPSNVFVAGQKIAISVETKGDMLECVATDFWGKEVFKETVKVVDNAAVICPPSKNGYFLLSVESRREDGSKVGNKYASYAVIPEVKVEDKEKSPFGAMTHFSQKMPLEVLPVLAKAGITTIRDEIYWGSVEREKGKYVFPGYGESFMKECKANEIETLVEMTFENKLYDNGNTPCTPEGYKGYADYGAAIAEKFGSQVKWLEIWNEYNGSFCHGPAKEDRPKYYTEMLKVSYETIKKARPDIKVLGGAVVLVPMPFFEKLFKNGALSYMDGVVIHPYRGRPEGVEKNVAALKEMIRKYNNGVDKPIWATETGKMDKSEYEWEKDRKMYEKGRRNVANYLVKQYSLLLSEDVEKIYWYLAADHDVFTTMGLLRGEKDPMGKLAVAPAYVAYANLVKQIHDSKCMGREAFGKYTRAYVIRFRKSADEDILVCWGTYPSRIEVEASGPVVSTNLMGEEKSLAPDSGKILVDLGNEPFFIRGPIQKVKEIESEEKIIASSADDYGKEQGFNNWNYGYFEISPEQSREGKYEFKEMNVVETMWGENWAGPYKFLSLGGGGAHPEIADGKQIWAVRRWKSGYAGKVQISGRCYREDEKGDGVEFVILQDGKEIFRQKIGGGSPMSVDMKLDTEIREGSIVDFCVSPNSNTEYDSTNSDIMIKTIKI